MLVIFRLLDRLYTGHITCKWSPFFETLALRTKQENNFIFFVVPTLGTDPTKSLKVKELGKNYPETTIISLRVLKYLELTGFFVSEFFLEIPGTGQFLDYDFF
jgi:hypothetical protein